MRGVPTLCVLVFLFAAVGFAQQEPFVQQENAEVASAADNAPERKMAAELSTLPAATEVAIAPIKPVLNVARPVELPSKVSTHKFFDRTNWTLTAMTFSAALADGITTQHALGLRRTSYSTVNGVPMMTVTTYVEKNPIAKPLVNQGWPGQIAATAITASADLGIRAWLHKRGHHRLERIVPFAFAATSAGFAKHNSGDW